VTSHSLLADGTAALIRPYTQADAAELERFSDALSAESRRLRFHGSVAADRGATLLGGIGSRPYVAFRGTTMIGVSCYVPLVEPAMAEMAVAVADAEHGRGVGTVLFEAMAAAARAEGITRMLALVLSENRAMAQVLDDLGFQVSRHASGGAIEFTVDLADTAGNVAAADRRTHAATTASLAPLMRPSSIAVVGASRRPNSVGGHLIANLVATFDAGALYAINPSAARVGGVDSFPSATALPETIDLAVIAVAAAAVPAAVADCLAGGARAILVLSAGFAETGREGAALQREVVELCRAHGARLVGPNCLGVRISAPEGAFDATFAGTRLPPGRVALVSQSGAVGIVLLEDAAATGLGIGAFVSTGNGADVAAVDLLEWFEDDERIGLVALYVETFGDPRRFARVARRLSAVKPLVILKAGRTVAGQRAAASHTAAIAAREDVTEALFRQAGIVRVDTLENLLDATRVLDACGVPAGGRLGIVTNAGGLGILAADAAAAAGLELPGLGTETVASLRRVLSPDASAGNPTDVLPSASPEAYAEAVGLVHDDPAIDIVCAMHVPALDQTSDAMGYAIRRARDLRPSGKPIIACLVAASGEPPTLNPPGSRGRIPLVTFPERAVLALGHAARIAAYRRRRRGDPPGAIVDLAAAHERIASTGSGWLGPAEGFALLEACGIPVIRSRVVATRDAAVAAADEIGLPVAVKLASRTILHKSDAGGVQLGVGSADAVGRAFDAIRGAAVEIGGDEAFEGVVVQATCPPGRECLIGAVQDPTFGPLVAFGFGGVDAELYADTGFRIAPLTDVDAEELLRERRGSPQLDGYRGRPAADVDALRDIILRISALVDGLPAIAELDINPVVAGPPGSGAVALDVRVRIG
jgi:acyl-CoA synthetase (NDP forming)/GNAT superfamily N-acetyltransferase